MRFARDVPIQDLHIIRLYPHRLLEEFLDYIWHCYVQPHEMKIISFVLAGKEQNEKQTRRRKQKHD